MKNKPLNKNIYWNGNVRIISDIFWCLFLSILTAYISKEKIAIEEILGQALSFFFIFFFWSWNKEHLKAKMASYIIPIFCWAWFLLTFCLSILFLYQLSFGLFFILIGMIIWTIFVAKKYSILISSKKNSFLKKVLLMRLEPLEMEEGSFFMKIKRKFHAKLSVKIFIISSLLCGLLFYFFLNKWSVADIGGLVFFFLSNKTFWLYLFLFWFGWNLISVLKKLNNTWIESIKKNNNHLKNDQNNEGK